jgi:GT2 family glycosyltransferase
VIPTLLGLKRLSECLPSLLASRYPADRMRVVVVDNGAGCAAAVRRRWPRVHVTENRRNQGFTLACNQGARAAEGAEVLAFLNDDVVIEPDWLRELVAPLVRRECESTGARMLLLDGSVEYAGGGSNFHGCASGHPFAALGDRERPEDVPRRALFACGGAMAVRAGAFEHVAGFDEEYFAYYDDLDLGWRLWLAGYAVHYVPSAVCRHRRSATSRTFPPEQIRRLQIRNALLTCVKNYAEESLERTLPALVALAARRSFVMARCREGPGFALGARSLQGFLHRVLLRRGFLPRLAKADLLGLNDVLGRFEHWTQRRAQVQALSRRAEPEILRLFVDPFWCVEGERGYVELQRELCARHGIDRLFE